MSRWGEVGDWIKENAGAGAALVGSLLTGNAPGAVAAGVALVSSATGTNDPGEALATLQRDGQAVIRLRELAVQNETDVRRHIESMARIELETFEAGQETIRAGDVAEDAFVRRTRPAMAWASLVSAGVYTYTAPVVDSFVLGAWLTLPWAYAGLRQIGKGVDSWTQRRTK